mmetsp:Transcript_30537/g.41831  ORF Transcript_30537/g.41831 Transcript_30537/m.41831 type:complete len:229 (+) Transcript_30537:646-1332(+)
MPPSWTNPPLPRCSRSSSEWWWPPREASALRVTRTLCSQPLATARNQCSYARCGLASLCGCVRSCCCCAWRPASPRCCRGEPMPRHPPAARASRAARPTEDSRASRPRPRSPSRRRCSRTCRRLCSSRPSSAVASPVSCSCWCPRPPGPARCSSCRAIPRRPGWLVLMPRRCCCDTNGGSTCWWCGPRWGSGSRTRAARWRRWWAAGSCGSWRPRGCCGPCSSDWSGP